MPIESPASIAAAGTSEMRRRCRNCSPGGIAMFAKLTGLVKASVLAFSEDGALTYGAAIAYYTVFSIAPVLLIVIAIAGLVFSWYLSARTLSGHRPPVANCQFRNLLRAHLTTHRRDL
jgi:hypothetical protein